ncbi:hypothetical protein BHE74_00011135 [Ensete ventricosum]|nr:hypothetical protein GW17_00042039 [Ensete ventricosum]RWW80506.1 hypothetical protein BHE74_00011135 [Ensete ventricosum]
MLPRGVPTSYFYRRTPPSSPKLLHVVALPSKRSLLSSRMLSSMGFNGTLSSKVGELAYLEVLELSGNNITGNIPVELGNLSRLTRLSLHNNRFTGEIPATLGRLPKLKSMYAGTPFQYLTSFTGNHLSCGANFLNQCESDLLNQDHKIEFGQLKRFSWRELQIATGDFNEKNVLGQGGFGKVYVGVLSDNSKVAIKRLTDYGNRAGEDAFLREPVLDWPTRKQVAMDTAHGLEYLHEHCNPKIIHRDVKAANILLDENFEAVVGDFGLAKLVDVRKTSVTTRVRGTMGHIAPEYLSTGKSSNKTDVFGYGIMLLELVTGQRAIDISLLDGDVLLLDKVRLLNSRSTDFLFFFLVKVKKLSRENQLNLIIDPNLDRNYDILEVEKLIQISLLCTQASPEDRPIMSDVIRMLEGEGLTERWEQLQQVAVTQKQDYERIQKRLNWDDDTSYNQEAIELSGAR